MNKVRKRLPKPMKILLCVLICALLLFFWWALLKFPALTPSGAFRKFMKENLISGVEEKLTLKLSNEDVIVLGEADGKMFQLPVSRYGTNLYWTPWSLKITPATDGIYMVPLTPMRGVSGDRYSFAVNVTGSRLELELIYGKQSIPMSFAGEQDGWTFFSWEDEAPQVRADEDQSGAQEDFIYNSLFLGLADVASGHIFSADPVELHLRIYDAQDQLSREVMRSFPTDEVSEGK